MQETSAIEKLWQTLRSAVKEKVDIHYRRMMDAQRKCDQLENALVECNRPLADALAIARRVPNELRKLRRSARKDPQPVPALTEDPEVFRGRIVEQERILEQQLALQLERIPRLKRKRIQLKEDLGSALSNKRILVATERADKATKRAYEPARIP